MKNIFLDTKRENQGKTFHKTATKLQNENKKNDNKDFAMYIYAKR